MHPHENAEFEAQAVKVTWCACERCNAVGPRQMTVVKNKREYSVTLQFECCGETRRRKSFWCDED